MWSLLFLLSSASAEGGLLVQQWAQGPVRYHMEALIDTPRSMLHQGVKNVEARATRHMVVGDFTCTAAPATKRWKVDCVVDSITFRGVGISGEQADLDSILADYGRRLAGKTVSLTVQADGRITSLDFTNLEKSDQRTGTVLETMRMLTRRLFAPLDLQLPKNGDDQGKPWKQKGAPLATELLTRYGTAGGTLLKHQVDATTEKGVDISSTGRGSVTSGEMLEAGTGGMMKIVTSGRGRFDPDAGVLIWREIRTEAKYTVSAYSASIGGRDYAHQGWVGRIGEDGKVAAPPPITSP